MHLWFGNILVYLWDASLFINYKVAWNLIFVHKEKEEKKIYIKNSDTDYNNFGATNFHKYYTMFSIAVILYSVRYDNAISLVMYH